MSKDVFMIDKEEKEAAEKYSFKKWKKAKLDHPNWEWDNYAMGYVDAVDTESEKDFLEGSQWRRKKVIEKCDGSNDYLNGYKEALHDIEKEIDFATVNQYDFIILHIRDFIDKKLGRKEDTKQ